MTRKTVIVATPNNTTVKLRADGWDANEDGSLAVTDSTLADPIVAVFAPAMWSHIIEARAIPQNGDPK